MSFYGSASIQVRERTRRTGTHDALEAAELLLVPTEARERRGAAEVAAAQWDVPRNDVCTPPPGSVLCRERVAHKVEHLELALREASRAGICTVRWSFSTSLARISIAKARSLTTVAAGPRARIGAVLPRVVRTAARTMRPCFGAHDLAARGLNSDFGAAVEKRLARVRIVALEQRTIGNVATIVAPRPPVHAHRHAGAHHPERVSAGETQTEVLEG